jgi:anti-anti-sigma regulatory factor
VPGIESSQPIPPAPGFIDSSGVQCVLAAQRDAESLGTTLGVDRPRPNVLLVFDLLGLTDRLVVEGAS